MCDAPRGFTPSGTVQVGAKRYEIVTGVDGCEVSPTASSQVYLE
jgi:hypothetical protein